METIKKIKYDSGLVTTMSPIIGTLEEKEDYILSNFTLLKLDDFELTENDDCLEDWIYNLLAVYKNEHATVPVDDLDYCITTIGRHRSLLDIYLLSKHYFPDCTLKEVIIALYTLYKDNHVGSQICSTVNRRVYESLSNHPGWRTFNHTIRDEFNMIISDYENLLN